MAADEIGPGRLGRMVEVVSADAGGDPARGTALVQQWVGDAGVEAVAVVPDDPVARTVQDACRTRARIALFCGPTAAALSREDCSPTGFQWLADDEALARAMAAALDGLGVRACRIVDGAAAARAGALRRFLAAAGIAEDDQAGAATVLVADDALPPATTSAPRAGPILAARLSLARIAEAGPAATAGIRTIAAFNRDSDDGARAWVRRFLARTGRLPEEGEIATYEAVRHYLKNVAELGRSSGAALARRMRATPVESPFSHNAPIGADGQVRRPLWLMRVSAATRAPGPAAPLAAERLIPPRDGARRPDDPACPA
jgi:branched-chain amino acid transport system substrate-binding protein